MSYATFFFLSLFLMLQHSCLESLSCFIFASCFSMSHESSRQHDSIEQQASAFFFCSPCDGVCAVATANAISSKPRRRIRIVFLRGFIVILLFLEINASHAGQNAPTRG